jgi:hypothetical protein
LVQALLSAVFITLACGASSDAVQTAIVGTLTAFPTTTVTPWPTSTPSATLTRFSLEVGDCYVYLQYGGDPKTLGCTLLDTRTVSLAPGEDATASVISPHASAYSYCALFAADGSLVGSYVNPNQGASTVQCEPSAALVSTAQPATQTAILASQAAGQTAEARDVLAARTAVERQILAYATADSATATAYYRALSATQTATERQARASATSFSATATRAFKVARATEVAHYTPIDASELLADADRHVGEKVVISGQVFEISGSEIQIYVRGKDLVRVEAGEPVSGIAVGQSIRAYGTVEGTACLPTVTGGQVCQPVLTDAFYTER